MERLEWNNSYDTGIDEIDNQHKQLIEFLNDLYAAGMQNDDKAAREVLAGTVDYTLSHFAFEESLMTDAKYQYVNAHKSIHEMFIKRVAKFQERLQAGEDITEELYTVLKRWLIQHIQRDDAAYVKTLSAYFDAMNSQEEHQEAVAAGPKKGWLARAVGKFFNR